MRLIEEANTTRNPRQNIGDILQNTPNDIHAPLGSRVPLRETRERISEDLKAMIALEARILR